MMNFFFYTRNKRAAAVLCAGILSTSMAWALRGTMSYVDNGKTIEVTDYVLLTGSETVLEDGTCYAVDGNISFDHPLAVQGEVYLILCDGCTMSIGTQENPVESGIAEEDDSYLYLLGQSRDEQTAGKLDIYASGTGIGVSFFCHQGGCLHVASANGNAIEGDDVTLSGVAAHITSANGIGVKAGYIQLGDCDLGYVYASSYSGEVYCGQTITNEEGWSAERGTTLDASDYDQIDGKVLRPVQKVVAYVSYIDEQGNEQQISDENLTLVSAGTTSFDGGWYLVNSDVTISQKVSWSGDSHIILCDGCTLSFGTESEPIGDSPCFSIGYNNSSSITLYGQEKRTGTLAINCKGYVTYSSCNLMLNACNLTANCGKGIGAAFMLNGDVTVNDANVSVVTDETGFFLANDHAFNFNGGSVNVGGSGIYGQINLQWNDISDRFTSNGFGFYENITMADGQVCTNGTEVFSGTFVATKAGTDTVTLQPCRVITLHSEGLEDQLLPALFDADGTARPAYTPEAPVREGYTFSHWSTQADGSDVINFATLEVTDNMDAYAQWSVLYIAADGTETKCAEYTLLTGAETELAAGWYLAEDTINFAAGITLTGDIHLILSDDAVMNVQTSTGTAKYSGFSIPAKYSIASGSDLLAATCDVNIYSQAKGTGTLNAVAAIAAKDITICGGIVNGGSATSYVGIGASANITIYSGKVTANGSVRGLGAVKNVTLGWRNASDRIMANAYSGTISIADGQTLTDGSGILLSGDVTKLKTSMEGKTLLGTHLLDDTADAPFASLVGQRVNVTLANRTLDTDWNTLALPFSVPMDTLKKVFGDDVKLYQFGNSGLSEDGVLTFFFTAPDYLVAGYPHFIRPSVETENPTFCNVTILDVKGTSCGEDESSVDFVPTLGATTLGTAADDPRSVIILGAANTLYNPTTLAAKMKGFRGFFRVRDNVANASQFRMTFEEETEVSGIIDAQVKNEELRNKSCDAVYNLMGQRVNRASKGMFIVNGKRVIRP